jgi:predicted DNA-binding protein (UPF0251 family)
MPDKPNGKKTNGVKRQAIVKHEPEETEVTKTKKGSDHEIEERRIKALRYRLRGLSLRDIAEKLEVSAPTIKRDLDAAREMGLARIQDFDKDDFVSDTMHTYDDIISAAWDEFTRAPKGTTHRLKSLDAVRNATNDKRKALQEAGVVRNEDQKTALTVNLGVVGEWSDDVKKAAITALINSATKTDLLDPVPDEDGIVDAEIVEPESE